MMKKWLALLLALTLALSLAACSGKDNTSGDNTSNPASQSNDGADSENNKIWEESYLAKYLPYPTMSVQKEVTRNDDGRFTVMMTWTVDEAKSYAEACKLAGFTISPSEQTNEAGNLYGFTSHQRIDGLFLQVIVMSSYNESDNYIIIDDANKIEGDSQ